MFRSLLAAGMMLAVVAPASTGVQMVVAPGYSAVVLERLPGEDLALIAAALEPSVAECRPAAQTVAC